MQTLIEKALKSYNGTIGDGVLYKLCEDLPGHTNRDTIIAKTWLIGRSYAVQLERRKEDGELLKQNNEKSNNLMINDDFYNNLAEIIKEQLSEKLDQSIEKSRQSTDIKDHFETYRCLVKMLFGINSKTNRSFTSKYLHFHLPDKFFIYDSRAAQTINELMDNLKLEKKGYNNPIKDDEEKDYKYKKIADAVKEYAIFHQKCLAIQEKLTFKGRKLTPREIDIILIHLANEKLRKK